ncbi:N-acetylglucosamine 6-phosphate deacetylase [Xanthomonas phaseoli pv. phaseoli]|uniref:N-acetylglucosamine-6-phosphate deacetylase n=1 Tax=Xanthomonas campestris pv. phaseoli TaxID=317013 RepID=A0AB38E125_XANCH|nr:MULTISPECIES: N-acetylglucosamine-6-phosphate deacetylase [Xanthomonas]ATS20107.1 N-acetylglucosamine-6-phosphate deacetylase [Xanthomonas phaseoli pv. phaseoli]ATS26755.1 N-acetylglucosamine-6-phosphate deacetylase [Xanthomonas phaseoli pv. phaseoli]ATS29773.1 N-acetylglucosamine-6-phosphate deacetylase [Xanthomonas phaseoli pv. phaseoli]ATS35017.1 N-acetylglucosamine-6-phosphate deacetylase [Xanthomonas phaseoli pv. phaseoli]AZU11835.1 N-acetylglucosamine 6-phosphate deacetylase [Xanthomo
MHALATQALCNARVLTDNGLQDGLVVMLAGTQIQAIVPADDARVAQAHTRVDLGGATLLPGFIDIQVNGGGGVLFNNARDPQALATIAAAHRRFGTTGMLPTLISDTAQVMAEAIDATRQAIAQGVPGVLGIHLEGPYLSPARKGTHDADKFRVPDAHEIAVDTSLDNGVTLITLAPERVPVEDIRAFVSGGAIVFAGHTAATYEQARDGIAAGVSGFTHVYNAMSQLAGREPNAVGAALEDLNVWCGVIVDGVHVHPASLRVALAAKPRGKLLLVTDAMPMVGSDSASFDLYGETITAVDGMVRNADGALAGSALDMATAVRNSVRWLGVDLAEAARMASTYPAQCIGLGERLGRIAPGYQADLVLVDDDVQVLGTWVAGQRD